MLHLRRSALRVLSSSPSSLVRTPRTFTSLSSRSIVPKALPQSSFFQRRWATGEAEAKKEDEDVPISTLQPTAQEEVENAISEDNAATTTEPHTAEATSVAEEVAAADAPVAETANATEATEESVPEAETSTIDTSAQSVASTVGIGEAATETSRSSAPPQRKPREVLINEPKATIYIGNLFFDVTESDLEKELARFGKVEKVRLMRDARGLSKGFGYVDFDTVEAATSARSTLDQQIFEGRRITVQYAAFSTKALMARRETSTRPTNPPTKTLFIGNMSFEMTDRDLSNLFRGIRNVIDVRVAIDRRTGQPRGFAHADFIDVKSAMEAMKILSEKETYGRRLRVDYSYGSNAAPKNQVPPPE